MSATSRRLKQRKARTRERARDRVRPAKPEPAGPVRAHADDPRAAEAPAWAKPGWSPARPQTAAAFDDQADDGYLRFLREREGVATGGPTVIRNAFGHAVVHNVPGRNMFGHRID